MISRIPQKFAASVLFAAFLITVQPRTSHAYAPVIIAAGALGALVLVAGASTLYKPVTVPSGWGSGGRLTTGGAIVRILLESHKTYTAYGQEVLMGNYVSAKANMEALAAKLASGSQAIRDKYNDLTAMLVKDTNIPIPAVNMSPGTVFKADGSYGGNYKINSTTNSVIMSNTPGSWCSTSQGSTCVGWTVISPRGDGYADVSVYDIALGSPPPPTAKTQQEIVAQYPSMIIPPAAIDELDQMIAENANGYGVSIIDSTTADGADNAPLWLPPPAVTSPLNPSAPTSTGFGTPTVTAATGNATTASTALNQAQTDLANYQATHPGATRATDPALAGFEDAVAEAIREATRTQQAVDNAKTAQEEVYPNANIEALKTLNFESLKALSGAMTSVFPFNLLSQVSSVYDSLVREPQAPAFDVSLPLGNTVHVDLSIFDSLASACRFLVGLLLTVGVVYYIVRFYRGVA